MNRLREILDQSTPSIAVPFANSPDDKAVYDMIGIVDVCELRADFQQDYSVADTMRIAERLRVLAPVLLTIRHTSEAGGAGGWSRSEAERIDWYERLLRVAEGADIGCSIA